MKAKNKPAELIRRLILGKSVRVVRWLWIGGYRTRIRFLLELKGFFLHLTASRLNVRYSELPITKVKRVFDPC